MRREKSKGQLCVLFTAAVLMALTACGNGEQTGQAGDPGHSEGSRMEDTGAGEQSAFGGASAESDPDGRPEDGTGTAAAEPSSSELPQPYARYMEVLEQIRTEGEDPNGRGYALEGDFAHNCFAIRDVDNDGRQELIFNFNESYMAGMHEVVYDYDEGTDTLREELSDWVSTTYYNNGIVKVELSHNHGRDPYERGVWPYDVYQYDAEEDGYKRIYRVDSWDGMIYEDFPDEKDVDGDKLLYYIGTPGLDWRDSEDVMILDSEEYHSWAGELMPEWRRIDLVYHHMEEDFAEKVESAYAQAAAYAAQADAWFAGEEAGAPCNYLLYDLDGDGSLELVTSVMQGTGRFSDNHFYSLTDSGEIRELELVRLCDGEGQDWNADFDIGGVVRVQAYQDSEGTIYYEGTDYMREGTYGVIAEDGFYYLKDGVVYHDSIRWREEIFHADNDFQEDEIYYYSMERGSAGEATEIAEEQYEAIREEYVKDMIETGVYLNWANFSWEEITQGNISEEDIRMKLFESALWSG